MFFIFDGSENLQRGISLTRVRADFRFAICALTLTYIVTASICLAVSRCNDFCILSDCVLGLKPRTCIFIINLAWHYGDLHHVFDGVAVTQRFGLDDPIVAEPA